MKYKLLIILLLILSGFDLLSQDLSNGEINPSEKQNFRIYPGDVTQTEVFITNNPGNPEILFCSCNTLTFIPFFVSEGVYVSTDAGSSWIGSDTCKGDPISFHGGDPGIAIDKNGTLIITRLGRTPFNGLYSHYSLDNGITWSSQKIISTDDLERASLATDPVPSSQNYGRSYAVWIKFAPPFPVMFSFTDDGAKNWNGPEQVNNPTFRGAGGDIAIGQMGEVYICWAGVTSTSPFKEKYVGFASSLDGGDNWALNETAFEVNGVTGILPEKENIRVNGLPGIAVDTTSGMRKGWIYIVTGQKDKLPAGSDPDIILNRSADGGMTWSDGIRINQDGVDNGRIQYFPSVHVDRFGYVNVIYYDDRNTTSDSSGVFLARSADGGDSWIEYEISDHNFKPTPIGGLGQGYQGDNIDLTSTNSTLYPVWMDNSTGTYQIWTGPLDFENLNKISDKDNAPPFRLYQNYPNPFMGKTNIRFSLSVGGHINLRLFDVLGNLKMNIVDKRLPPGKHEVLLDSGEAGLSPGIYWYRIAFRGTSGTKKIILLDN